MSVIIDGSAGVTTNAGGSVNPSTNIDGINFSCRAFVNFDGFKDTTGATSTANTNRLIRGSGNVASVLRNGTGDYTVNFTTAMANVNYATNVTPQATAGNTGLMGCLRHSSTPTTSAVRVSVNAVDAGFRDTEFVLVSVFL